MDLLADSSKFPDEWLFNHRWGKGKKDAPTTLPNGEKITFLTVGGRTSCVAPSLQKKSGPVAGDINTASTEKMKSNTKEKLPQSKKRKGGEMTKDADLKVKLEPKAVNGRSRNSGSVQKVEQVESKPKKRRASAALLDAPAKPKSKLKHETDEAEGIRENGLATSGRRRSVRISKV